MIQSRTDFIFELGIITILIFISGCLLYYFFSSNKQKDTTKFIGGFSVMLVALYADNAWVYSLSVFIAGLIIASERFMSLLVTVLKGNKEFLTSDNFIKMIEKMSGAEIIKKTENEVAEIQEAEDIRLDDDSKNKPSGIEAFKKKNTNYLNLIPEIESKAIEKFAKGSNLLYEEHVKFGNLYIDGFGYSGKKDKFYIFEVKVFPNIKNSVSDIRLAERIRLRLKQVIPQLLLALHSTIDDALNPRRELVLMILVVIDTDRNLDTVMKEVDKITELYKDATNEITVKIQYFNMPNLLQKENLKK